MTLTTPLDLDVGAVRGDGVDRALLRELAPLVQQISDHVGRIVDLSVTVGPLGDGHRAELRCWMAGLATTTATGTGPTVASAVDDARRQLVWQVTAMRGRAG